jgi:polyisoprenoid-binding protein YceI
MKQHWKKIVGALVAIVVLVVGASFVYAKIINKAPAKKTAQDAINATKDTTPVSAAATSAAGTVTTVYGGAATTAGGSATTAAASGSGDVVDGNWTIASSSTVDYRVKESINGFDTEGVGTTSAITGSLTIAGTQATAGEFTVDMTTFRSDQSRRDGQFNGRVMAVNQFPTSTFTLTAPIDFQAIPAPGTSVTATATGDLTLHGVTKSVTFTVNAAKDNGKIAVQGNIPVKFSDYSIENPSFGTISTEDHGLLEFVLVFTKA